MNVGVFFFFQSMQFAPCGTKCDDSGTDLGLAYGNRSAVLFRLHKYQVEGFWRIHSTHPPHLPPLSPLHLHTFSSLLLSLPRTFIGKCLVCMCGLDFFLSSFSLLVLPWVFAQNCWIWSSGEWQDFLVLFLSILQIFYCFFMTAVGEQLS